MILLFKVYLVKNSTINHSVTSFLHVKDHK
jgi:hypothetical protein